MNIKHITIELEPGQTLGQRLTEIIPEWELRGLSEEEWKAYLEQTQEEACKKAEAAGLEVYKPTDKEITLDLDNEESEKTHESMRPLVESILPIKFKEEWRSKSGHKHVVYSSEIVLTPEQKLLAQACLGSDLKREILGLKRVMGGQTENVSLLFKPTI